MPDCCPKTCTARAGITLIESLVSLSIISVLMIGLSGSVMIGAHAIPSENELGVQDRAVHDICNQIRADLKNASKVIYQRSGDTTRLTLSMVPSGAVGEGSTILYEFIGEINMLRRRVDGHPYEMLSNEMDAYRFDGNIDSGRLRYAKMQFQFNNTIQRQFELYALTPHRPVVE